MPILRRAWLTAGMGLVMAVIYLSVAPAPDVPRLPGGGHLDHVLAYAMLMFWFMQLADIGASRALIAVALIALGIALELAQLYVPGRTFEVADMVANAVGVSLGWLLAPPRTRNLPGALAACFSRR